jgi:hypothetical protein
MKKIKLLLTSLSIFLFSGFSVYAQQNSSVNLRNVSDLNKNKIELEKISIPFFKNFINFNTDNANLWTWAAFIGSLATVGLVIFWVYLILRAGVKALQSQGTPEGLEEAFKKIKSVFIGAALSFFFPVILSLAGIFLGIGSIFQWPKMFSNCNGTYQYYFQAYLDKDIGKNDIATTDAYCGV